MMDDVLVCGRSEAEHWRRLRKVLQRIVTAGMTLHEDKCEFGVSEVKFLGHVISAGGIEADPSEIAAIVEMSPPTNKEL